MAQRGDIVYIKNDNHNWMKENSKKKLVYLLISVQSFCSWKEETLVHFSLVYCPIKTMFSPWAPL